MPVSKNTWNNGLNSDLSKLKSQQDSYLDAKNIRVITDDGTSSLAVENVKGNTFNFQIPKVEATWKFDFTDVIVSTDITLGRNINGLLITITLTIDPTSKSNEFIANDLNQQLASFAISNPTLGWNFCQFYFNSGYLVLYDFLPQTSLLPSLNVNTTNGIHVLRTQKIKFHTILGQGYYNDNLVLITCNANSNNDIPLNTEGFLWNIEYDNATDTVISTSLDGVYLLPQPTLKYAGKLNLSREYAINKHLKCRFENVEIARVVWTDWYNDLRICNILDEQIYATPETLFSYTPQHFPQKPVVKALINGGTLPSGKYQYWYQLSSNQGATSTFSPVSNLINLFPGSVEGPTAFTTVGVNPGTNSNRSVQVNVINLDTNYDTIRFGYTVYQIPDFPESFFFDERPVPDTGILTVVHNGNENDIPVSSTNINNLNRSPQVFKTIDVVKNRLFAANAITTNFDLTDEFDARAYRFDNVNPLIPTARLYNLQDTYANPSVIITPTTISIEGATPIPLNFRIIPEDFDLINPFNNENPDPALNPFTGSGINGWATDSQYKYQINGTTIGGTGENISYEFVVHKQLPANGTFPTDLVYINPGIDYGGAYSGEQNDTYTYPAGQGSYLNSMKSPLQETLFTGYSRGEVYRWGVVFYDLNGNPSYTLWIGDIKFPFASDDNGFFGLTTFDPTTPPNTSPKTMHNVETQQVGIKFTLDTTTFQFQAIKDKISGWSYVRVKRELADKTRLGTGYIQPVRRKTGGTEWSILASFNYFPGPSPAEYARFGFNPTNPNQSLYNQQTIHIPNILQKQVGGFSIGDYVKFIARTNDYGVSTSEYYAKITNPPSTITPPAPYTLFYINTNDFLYTYTDSIYTPLSGNTYTEADSKFPLLGRLFVEPSTNRNEVPALTIQGQTTTFINMSAFSSSNIALNIYGERGNSCSLITFDTTDINYPNAFTLFPQTDLAWNSSTLGFPMYLISYERYLTGQYGGDSRANRYNNTYIFTNHFMPYSSSITGAWSNQVYGGDTWVNFYDYQRSSVNYFELSGYATDATFPYEMIGLAIFFPAEITFNSELNTIYQHASVRKNDATGTNTVDMGNYVYNPAYSQENSGIVFISKGYLQSNIIREPHTIYPSEPKLDGELTDSWRSLLINNALSVNGNYGEINRVIEFKDKLFFYQNDGVGIAAVDERVQINEGDVTQIQLGTGTVLQRFDYLSTQTGSKHSFAVEATGDGIYHYDAFINKMFKLQSTKDGSGISPLTDVKGLSGFFRTAFPIGSNLKSTDKILRNSARVGISSGFNSEYNSVYFTFFDQLNNVRHTLSYNELLDKFESFYDFYPSLYLNMRKRFLSIKPTDMGIGNSVYTHNNNTNRTTFYESYYPAYIKFRVNENSDFVKTFDNFQLNTEVINLANVQLPLSVTRLAINNDYQTVPETTANLLQKIRSWRIALPRDETNPALTIKPRISDKYIDVKFIFDNSPTYKFLLHDVLTEYSMRSKIVPK